MKIVYYSHASFKVSSSDNISVLTDPWIANPIYGNSICLFPQLEICKEDYIDQDYLYISHDHPDHLCITTLKLFKKSIKILIRKYDDASVIKNKLIDLGFLNIIEMKDRETKKLSSNFEVTLYCDHTSTDSLMIFKDDNHCFVDQNDCLLDEETYKEIGNKFDIDLGAVFYSGGSMYPGCFDYSHEKKVELTKKRIYDQFDYSISSMKYMKIKNIIPGANDMCLVRNADFDDYSSALPIEFKDYLAKKKVDVGVHLMSSGDIYDFGLTDFEYKRYFKSREEWKEKVEKYRNTSSIQDMNKKLDNWEKDNKFDEENFENLFNDFLTKTKVEKQESVKINNFNVYLEVKRRSSNSLKYKITLDDRTNSLEKIDNLFNEKDYHMKIIIDDYLVEMCMNGRYQWEDLLNNRWRVIRKNNDFSEAEYYFWIYLTKFSDYLLASKKLQFIEERDSLKLKCWEISVTS